MYSDKKWMMNEVSTIGREHKASQLDYMKFIIPDANTVCFILRSGMCNSAKPSNSIHNNLPSAVKSTD